MFPECSPIQALLRAIEVGNPVLVEAIQEEVAPLIDSLLSQKVFQQQETMSDGWGETKTYLQVCNSRYSIKYRYCKEIICNTIILS
jgi:hypothetical protein